MAVARIASATLDSTVPHICPLLADVGTRNPAREPMKKPSGPKPDG